VTIIPDTKDWTWVLQRPCPACDFDSRSFPREQIPSMLRDTAGQWRVLLAGTGDLRRRHRPDVWSALEYACHVRDVCRVYLERLELMLTRDDPAFPNWDQDATAVDERYGEQDPEVVSGELVDAAHRLADGFAAVTGEQWQRPGRRSDGATFTVESFGRYFIHDPIHHLYDVTGSTSI
jgi:DinB superfamily